MQTSTTKRIAVILPIPYRGGSLRGAKLFAEALWYGSRQAGEPAEIIFAHLDDQESYPDHEFADMIPDIKRRSFAWDILSLNEAHIAMHYAGLEYDTLSEPAYQVPNDYQQQFLDCDLWIIVSDRLAHPLLPMRPYCCMIYDYIQRYVPIIVSGADQSYLNGARSAKQVLVTTRFTEQDALQYAGISSEKLARVPMLMPNFKSIEYLPSTQPLPTKPYFIWPTNPSPHKNHGNAILALKAYYDAGGTLDCHITGANTQYLFDLQYTHIRNIAATYQSSLLLKKHIKLMGELPDTAYRQQLAQATFLWHAGKIDNGTFCVVEAAQLGVPSLSSDYPAMHDMDVQYQLNLAWMPADQPIEMAKQLLWMEAHAQERKALLPDETMLASQQVEHLAENYWKVIRKCL